MKEEPAFENFSTHTGKDRDTKEIAVLAYEGYKNIFD